jgi:uncharacterized membrane-anchored protein YhcB (DUF1043 family)
MFTIRLFELALSALALLVIVTQVLFPLIDRKPLFPVFRKKKKAIERELEEVNQQLEEKKLQQELDAAKKRLDTPDEKLDL